MNYLKLLLVSAYFYLWQWQVRIKERRFRGDTNQLMREVSTSQPDSEEAKRSVAIAIVLIIAFIALGTSVPGNKETGVPKPGEYLLYLFLTKKDREYLIGDLAEEYLEVQSKFGRRAANIWYYKQVVTSAWPMLSKAVGWGLLASIGAWIRRSI